MKLIASIAGASLVLTALAGFFNPTFMGMMLNPLHSSFLLLMGAVSLYFGIRGTEFEARNMNRVLGVLFSLLGLMTLLAGPGVAQVGEWQIDAQNVLKLIPGHLEYTTADGIRDLLLGVVTLAAGLLPREAEIAIDTKADAARQKAASR